MVVESSGASASDPLSRGVLVQTNFFLLTIFWLSLTNLLFLRGFQFQIRKSEEIAWETSGFINTRVEVFIFKFKVKLVYFDVLIYF